MRARDMTRSESNLTSIAFAAKAPAPLSQSSAGLLALMEELESSLAGSHEALLKLDLAGIEQGTSHQAGLIEKLDAIRKQSENGAIRLPARADELWAEIHRSRTRILQAARLQAALLARAQLKLRVLANMLAGPSADYGPLLDRRGRDRRGSRSQEGSE